MKSEKGFVIETESDVYEYPDAREIGLNDPDWVSVFDAEGEPMAIFSKTTVDAIFIYGEHK